MDTGFLGALSPGSRRAAPGFGCVGAVQSSSLTIQVLVFKIDYRGTHDSNIPDKTDTK